MVTVSVWVLVCIHPFPETQRPTTSSTEQTADLEKRLNAEFSFPDLTFSPYYEDDAKEGGFYC